MNYYFEAPSKRLIAYDEEAGTLEFLESIRAANVAIQVAAPAIQKPLKAAGYKFEKFDKPEKKRGRPSKVDINIKQKAWETYRAPLSQNQYNDARRMRLEEITAVQTAAEMNQPIAEVNYAYRSDTFENYVALSRREAFK